MAVKTLPVWATDGRLAGCYLYFLVCREGDVFFIKIGITKSPAERLRSLVNNCPIKADRFATVRLWSREKARSLEAKLHETLSDNRVTGEWFKFSPADKEAFNTHLRNLLAAHSMPSWPLVVDQMPVQPFIKWTASRKRVYWASARKKGRAYLDFRKHLTGLRQ
jgi:hypothetical protein